MALNIPDELTLDHIWKEKKREYAFDAVFAPGIGQEKARTTQSWRQAGVPGQALAGELPRDLSLLSCARLGSLMNTFW